MDAGNLRQSKVEWFKQSQGSTKILRVMQLIGLESNRKEK